jgi:glyoxylase-like metal-dependent hydrolase (beta-lactamase superfamily II)
MMKLHVIYTEDFKLDGGASFGVVPKTIWSLLVQPDENNYINVCNRLLLVETGDRKILIDSGIGNKQDEKYLHYFFVKGNTLEEALSANGFTPNDITDVLLTHLHFDHVGGCIKYNEDRTKTENVFPNATYYCSKPQWDWAVNPNFREKAAYLPENYLPLFEQGKFEFIMKEGFFSEGITLMFMNGHTEGQVIPIIDYKGKKIVFMADFIAIAEQIPIPYVPSYDVRPLLSYKEKNDFLEKAAIENYILFFEHDPRHECCTVHHTKKGIRMKEYFKLDDIG